MLNERMPSGVPHGTIDHIAFPQGANDRLGRPRKRSVGEILLTPLNKIRTRKLRAEQGKKIYEELQIEMRASFYGEESL